MIIKRKHTSNFTVISNELLCDTRISVEARWCMAYLLSKPNDWELRASDLMLAANWGRDKAYKVIRELINAGWIRREVTRSSGAFSEHQYIVTDAPLPENQEMDATPLPEKPDTVLPDTANQYTTKEGTGKRTDREPAKLPVRNTDTRQKRATRIPDGWTPSEEAFAKGFAEGFDRRALEEEVEKFVNYWTAKAGRDATKVSWDATFRNWIINAKQYRRTTNGKSEPAKPQWQLEKERRQWELYQKHLVR